jgi:hypothetical protein
VGLWDCGIVGLWDSRILEFAFNSRIPEFQNLFLIPESNTFKSITIKS